MAYRYPKGPVPNTPQAPPGFGIGRFVSEASALPYRYWRLFGIDGDSAAYFSIAELQFRATIGGADLATEAQTIFGDQRNGFEATLAFDNDGGTQWSVDRANPADSWIGQDFGSEGIVAINEVAVTSRSSFFNHTPRSFHIQRSDDNSTWVTEWTVLGEDAWSASETRLYPRPDDR